MKHGLLLCEKHEASKAQQLFPSQSVAGRQSQARRVPGSWSSLHLPAALSACGSPRHAPRATVGTWSCRKTSHLFHTLFKAILSPDRLYKLPNIYTDTNSRLKTKQTKKPHGTGKLNRLFYLSTNQHLNQHQNFLSLIFA